jgi:hypothetical protein
MEKGPRLSENGSGRRVPNTIFGTFTNLMKSVDGASTYLKDTSIVSSLSMALFSRSLTQEFNVVKANDWVPFYVRNTDARARGRPGDMVMRMHRGISHMLTHAFSDLARLGKEKASLHDNVTRAYMIEAIVAVLDASEGRTLDAQVLSDYHRRWRGELNGVNRAPPPPPPPPTARDGGGGGVDRAPPPYYYPPPPSSGAVRDGAERRIAYKTAYGTAMSERSDRSIAEMVMPERAMAERALRPREGEWWNGGQRHGGWQQPMEQQQQRGERRGQERGEWQGQHGQWPRMEPRQPREPSRDPSRDLSNGFSRESRNQRWPQQPEQQDSFQPEYGSEPPAQQYSPTRAGNFSRDPSMTRQDRFSRPMAGQREDQSLSPPPQQQQQWQQSTHAQRPNRFNRDNWSDQWPQRPPPPPPSQQQQQQQQQWRQQDRQPRYDAPRPQGNRMW